MEVFLCMLIGMFDVVCIGFEIVIGLIGMMVLWLGIMCVGECVGVVDLFVWFVNLLMWYLFFFVLVGYFVNGVMMMNVLVNVLGLDNVVMLFGL